MIIDTLVSFFLQETLYAFAGKRLHVGGCVFVRLLWKSSLNEEWLEWCPNFTSFTVLSEFLYGCVCVLCIRKKSHSEMCVPYWITLIITDEAFSLPGMESHQPLSVAHQSRERTTVSTINAIITHYFYCKHMNYYWLLVSFSTLEWMHQWIYHLKAYRRKFPVPLLTFSGI